MALFRRRPTRTAGSDPAPGVAEVRADDPRNAATADAPETGARTAPKSADGVSRRSVLVAGAGGVAAGALAGAGGMRLASPPLTTEELAASYHGGLTVPWQGEHQAGILTTPQGFLALMAFDLREGVDRERMGRLMRIWTDGINRLAEGRPGLTDTEPEFAEHTARLTVTVGFGPRMFEKLGMEAERPSWLEQLPPYSIDRLEEQWSEGDVVMQVCAEDPSTVAHAQRFFAKEAASFLTVRWIQRGYRNAAGQVPDGSTFRNQFGQLDGTSNLQGEEDEHVWIPAGGDTPAWLAGGTTMVVRRIHMDLDTWDELDRPGRENSIGRTMDTGAPLTGGDEFDEPDLEAKSTLGFPVIDTAAHIRRSRTDDPSQRIFRRVYNYDDTTVGMPSNHGLVFITFQKSVQHQYMPIQARLDELDLLNIWTTPIGSAVFAIPRGIQPGEYLAQDLFP